MSRSEAGTVQAMCVCLQGGFAGLVYASDATFKSGTVRCGKRVFRVRRAVPGTGFAFQCNNCDGGGWFPIDRALAEELEYPFREADEPVTCGHEDPLSPRTCDREPGHDGSHDDSTLPTGATERTVVTTVAAVLAESFCGCCGAGIGIEYEWCSRCADHVLSTGQMHERTFYAQHNRECPFQIGALPSPEVKP